MKFVKRLLAMSLMSVSIVASVYMFYASALNVGEIKSDTNIFQVFNERAFKRKREVYFNKGKIQEIEILHDSNWHIWNDRKVEVRLDKTDTSNVKIRTSVYYKPKNGSWEEAGNSCDLIVGDSNIWYIPEDAEFKVTGKWVQGRAGTSYFTISLSEE